MTQGALKKVLIVLASIIVAAIFSGIYAFAATNPSDTLAKNLSPEVALTSYDIAPPSLDKPDWYTKQVEAEKAKAAASSGTRTPTNGNAKTTVTYSVTSHGTIRGNLQEFAQQANATLNDPRGWSQLDAKFVQVASGGQFTLVLSQASLMTDYSADACLPEWSCTVGRNVIINDDRWMGATNSWNQAGGSLRDYRHMVVNHEVGHWLGHGHSSCGGAGQLAPVMQQQSMDLQGCRFNPWPLPSELWSNRI